MLDTMSKPVEIPDSQTAPFASTFHEDFPYDESRKRERWVLESVDNVHFHVPLEVLKVSTVLADAFALTPPDCGDDDGSIPPIPLTSATTAGLHYFLSILYYLNSPQYDQSFKDGNLKASSKTAIEAVRIAHVLEAPIVGEALLKRYDIDIYLRYTIKQVFNTANLAKPARLHPYEAWDVSFSLTPGPQYRACLDLLREIDAPGRFALFDFHMTRGEVMAQTLHRWSNPTHRFLHGARMSRLVHCHSCRWNSGSDKIFRYQLRESAPAMMKSLASSRLTHHRCLDVDTVLSAMAGKCSGCLIRLRAHIKPIMKWFDANFPAIPSEKEE